jgi:hypothetical protein
LNESLNIYRYCTSVGIYQGYDEEAKKHKIVMRNTNDDINQSKPYYESYLLDEFQFMIWYSCHGEIISEEKMFDTAGDFWNNSDSEIKRSLRKCYRELIANKLVYVNESANSDMLMYEVGTRIQPYVVSIFDWQHLQKNWKNLLKALNYTVSSLFLPSEERRIVQYFRKNLGATFLDYINDYDLMRTGKYISLGNNINNLLNGGYIFPVGWSSSFYPDINIQY